MRRWDERCQIRKIKKSKTISLRQVKETALPQKIEDLFVDCMEQNEELTSKILNDSDFKKVVSEYLMKKVYMTVYVRSVRKRATLLSMQF